MKDNLELWITFALFVPFAIILLVYYLIKNIITTVFLGYYIRDDGKYSSVYYFQWHPVSSLKRLCKHRAFEEQKQHKVNRAAFNSAAVQDWDWVEMKFLNGEQQ